MAISVETKLYMYKVTTDKWRFLKKPVARRISPTATVVGYSATQQWPGIGDPNLYFALS